MKTVIRLMMLMGMFAAVPPVMADEPQGNTPAVSSGGKSGEGKIDRRIEKQEKRIDHKLKKKKISQQQVDQLKSEVQSVQTKEQGMKAQGKLTKEQRKELHQELKQSSQDIKAAGSPVSK